MPFYFYHCPPLPLSKSLGLSVLSHSNPITKIYNVARVGWHLRVCVFLTHEQQLSCVLSCCSKDYVLAFPRSEFSVHTHKLNSKENTDILFFSSLRLTFQEKSKTKAKNRTTQLCAHTGLGKFQPPNTQVLLCSKYKNYHMKL